MPREDVSLGIGDGIGVGGVCRFGDVVAVGEGAIVVPICGDCLAVVDAAVEGV